MGFCAQQSCAARAILDSPAISNLNYSISSIGIDVFMLAIDTIATTKLVKLLSVIMCRYQQGSAWTAKYIDVSKFGIISTGLKELLIVRFNYSDCPQRFDQQSDGLSASYSKLSNN